MRATVWADGPAYEKFQKEFPQLVDPWPEHALERLAPRVVDLDWTTLQAVYLAGYDVQVLQPRRAGDPTAVLVAAGGRGFKQM